MPSMCSVNFTAASLRVREETKHTVVVQLVRGPISDPAQMYETAIQSHPRDVPVLEDDWKAKVSAVVLMQISLCHREESG
jgi:hypothetical protein